MNFIIIQTITSLAVLIALMALIYITTIGITGIMLWLYTQLEKVILKYRIKK